LHTVIIAVLSNRADLISGGDALIELLLPAGLLGQATQIGITASRKS